MRMIDWFFMFVHSGKCLNVFGKTIFRVKNFGSMIVNYCNLMHAGKLLPETFDVTTRVFIFLISSINIADIALKSQSTHVHPFSSLEVFDKHAYIYMYMRYVCDCPFCIHNQPPRLEPTGQYKFCERM